MRESYLFISQECSEFGKEVASFTVAIFTFCTVSTPLGRPESGQNEETMCRKANTSVINLTITIKRKGRG